MTERGAVKNFVLNARPCGLISEGTLARSDRFIAIADHFFPLAVDPENPFLVRPEKPVPRPGPAARLFSAAAHRPKAALAPGPEDFSLLRKIPDPPFGQGRRVGQASSGSRREMRNHEVAGKPGVITLAALPRNQIQWQKQGARFSPSALFR